jgi:dihydropteroate synthase
MTPSCASHSQVEPAGAASLCGPARWSWPLRGGRRVDIGGRVLLMGVVNVTPDSFSDGGAFLECSAAVEHALRLVAEGAAIVDVGGMSTRPGAAEVPEAEELRRVVPVIDGIRARSEAAISVDTYRVEVARRAWEAGADIVNDISAFTFDPAMLAFLAGHAVPAVAMHMRGTPRDMQDDPRYDDVVGEVRAFLAGVLQRAREAGVPDGRVAVDPGIGFGKTVAHNLELLRGLCRLRELGGPVLLGASRKSFIGKVLGGGAAGRLEGTLSVSALAVAGGADVVRVHDVAANLRAVRMAEAVTGRSGPWTG